MCVRSKGGGLVEITSEGAAPELGSSDNSAFLTGRPSPLRDPLPARQSNGTANSHDMAPDAIYFYSQDDAHTGYLSQWFQCLFTDDEGTTYISAEQYMMAAKARTHNEMGTHHAIMMAPDQATIKRLGRAMPNYNEDLWSQIRPAVLLAGNTLKFGQNPRLSSKLLLTSLSYLAEASATDAICGIGISVKDAYLGSEHQGQNLLGKALMEVRAKLLPHSNQQKKRPGQQPFDPTAPKRQCWVQCTHGAVRVAGSQCQPEGYSMRWRDAASLAVWLEQKAGT